MTSNFTIISDNRYDFLDVLLRNIIIKAGRKKIIFVEGYDDKIIFEILYDEYLDRIHFIDSSMKVVKLTTNLNIAYKGGCEEVKNLLKQCVTKLNNDKRFYGVIDRDLRIDADILPEKSLPDYDGRLFIFFERYTLENYFIEVDVLCDFLHGQSIKEKGLVILNPSGRNEFKNHITTIVNEILKCFTMIGAANLTIKHFDPNKKFLDSQIDCTEIEIKNRLSHRLKGNPQNNIDSKFNEFKERIEQDGNPHKFASAKDYFSHQFKHILKKVNNIQINSGLVNENKTELARILKKYELPNDFKELLNFLSVH